MAEEEFYKCLCGGYFENSVKRCTAHKLTKKHAKYVEEHAEINFDDAWEEWSKLMTIEEIPKKKIKPEKVKPHPYYYCPCGLILQYNCFGKHRQSFHHKQYEKDSGIALNKKNINEWAIPCTEEDFMRQKAEHKEKVLKFYESIKK